MASKKKSRRKKIKGGDTVCAACGARATSPQVVCPECGRMAGTVTRVDYLRRVETELLDAMPDDLADELNEILTAQISASIRERFRAGAYPPAVEPLHVVSVSGGVPSFITARRVVEAHGAASTVFLFADTLGEHPDLYRFLIAGCASIIGLPREATAELEARALALPPLRGGTVAEMDALDEARKNHLLQLSADAMRLIPQLTWIIEGRNIWQVYRDARFLGNSRIDPCSRVLKRTLLRAWHETFCGYETTLYIGLDFTELHRVERYRKNAGKWETEFPLLKRPLLNKQQMFDICRALGIEIPILYIRQFPHNNCSGGCCKAGQSSFKLLLAHDPETFDYWECREEQMREFLGANVAMIKERKTTRQGRERIVTSSPLTLRALRLRIEAGDHSQPKFDFGGCGCAV